jgi:heme-degrading monooxygenase HmoA
VLLHESLDARDRPVATKGAAMIARMWRGWAPVESADDYQRHYESEVAERLRDVPGFLDARLLRRVVGDSVLFTSIAFFSDLDAVRSFAGTNYEEARVEEPARRALSRWDERVSHHEVAVDVHR